MDNPLAPFRARSPGCTSCAAASTTASSRCRPTAPTGTIADVLSHLGSGAVIMQRASRTHWTGTQTPDDFAAVGVGRVERQVAPRPGGRLARRGRAPARGARGGARRRPRPPHLLRWARSRSASTRPSPCASTSTRSTPGTSRSSFDGGARLPADAAAVVVDNLGLIARFAAKPTGASARSASRTTDPVRHFTVRLTPDSAELLAGDAGHEPDLELPAEAFCRLVYGRLDPDHTPAHHGRRSGARPPAPGLPGPVGPEPATGGRRRHGVAASAAFVEDGAWPSPTSRPTCTRRGGGGGRAGRRRRRRRRGARRRCSTASSPSCGPYLDATPTGPDDFSGTPHPAHGLADRPVARVPRAGHAPARARRRRAPSSGTPPTSSCT